MEDLSRDTWIRVGTVNGALDFNRNPNMQKGKSVARNMAGIHILGMWEDKDGGGLLLLLITVSVLLQWQLAMLSGATLDVRRRHNEQQQKGRIMLGGDTESLDLEQLLDPIES